MCVVLLTGISIYAATPWLHADGNQIKDPDGNVVILRGVDLIDLGFLEAEQRRAGVPVWDAVVLDTLAFARQQYWFRRNSLTAIARELGIRTQGAHRALADALTTQAIYRRFANRLRQQQRLLVADWHRMQGGQVWRPSR